MTTELRQDRLYIRMTDNGTGMPEEELRRLQLELETPWDEGDRSEHIGLTNVMDRLRLYYGDQASMLLHAEPHGLTVVLTIPVRDEGGWA